MHLIEERSQILPICIPLLVLGSLLLTQSAPDTESEAQTEDGRQVRAQVRRPSRTASTAWHFVFFTDVNIVLNLVSTDCRTRCVVIAAVGRRGAVEGGPLLGRTGGLRRFARGATARARTPLLVLRTAAALLRALAGLLTRLAALATASEEQTAQ